jgi:hypothetical protein
VAEFIPSSRKMVGEMIDKRPVKEQIEDRLKEKLGPDAFEELERLEKEREECRPE